MDSQQIDQIISTLPTQNGWVSDENTLLYNFKGFWYYRHFLLGAITSQNLPSFNPSSSDTIICSTPKSGTTWLKALSFAITTRSQFTTARFQDNPLHSTLPHELIPLIEVNLARGHEPRDPELPLFATHLPYTSLPGSILSNGCKIVYIWRDPKDAFISRWHFAHKMRRNKDVTGPISLEEAFDLFCHGVSPFGPYWDHVLGFWEASLDRPEKILMFKYEDMMDDVEVHVKRLAEFMGYPFSVEEGEDGVVRRIVELCSFESLSKVNKGEFRSTAAITMTRDSFFRKGKVGDWKNHLTEEMARKMDQITVEKLGKFGVTL